ncbi:SNF2 domain-containing protein CLASSY 4-like [Cornus florida]|uniref:SNF2 domain-containing protein CLASSY 4-like n=1 Tax=Cornus florida TaxID=4283 RepID=UPI0028A13F16|nr:SNF2 domain-containing protein CLASSY 4-like [Cornus florida]XP_059644780.1 SNF2 domain-containing protein CLASSY 4-like [Cornus florida]XP_059644781.1 SNF2 domain-containing protein CLASSY 4-like [Cornus florida]XP_059644782.1 SNF2 domain-containing protein CLASSY 4-like [Cornus florida]XP_059644783.1 SNF2 domain-containing protein CLASSY 4-like [Cornus florida]
MDYGKVPLAKRTRFQENLFFRRYNDEKKKAKSAGSGLCLSESSGKREKKSDGEDRVRVEDFGNSGSVGDFDSESLAVSGGGKGVIVEKVVNSGVNLGERDGDVSVHTQRESAGSKEGKSKIDLQRSKNRVEFDVELEKNVNSEKIVKGVKNVVEISVESKKKGILGEKAKKNVVASSVDLAQKKRELKRLEAELKKKKKELMMMEKNRNVVQEVVVVDDDVDDDDDGSEDEIVLLDEVVHSCSSSLKMGSNKDNYCAQINVGEAVSYSEMMVEKSDGVNINDGKSSTPSQTPSEDGIEEKSLDDDDACVDLEDSEEAESSSEEDNDESSDEDFIVENSCVSVSSDETSSCEEEEEEEEEEECRGMESARVNAKGKEKMVQDGKRRKVNSCHAVSLEQSNSYSMNDGGEDGNGSSTVKAGSAEGEGKERREGGLKRKKDLGLDVLVDCSKEKNKEDTKEDKGVAGRLRQRRHVLSESRKEEKKLGTISHPLSVDEDEELTSSSEQDEGDGDYVRNHDDDKFTKIDDNTCSHNASSAKAVWKGCKKGKRVLRKLRKPEIVKILENSIWENGDSQLEDLVSTRDNDCSGEINPPAELPLKFRFEDEDPPPPEKSEFEKEVDRLFEELEFCLRSSDIGANSSMVGNNDNICLETEIDPITLCHQGEHQLIIDEQIGLRCEICSFVKLEIKHILPSFSKRPWGNRDSRQFGRSDSAVFDELQSQISGCENQSGLNCSVHEKGTVWDIIPGIKNSMYPHQQEGFEFIWKNIAGGIHLEKLKKPAFDGGSGCIISHAPGTGKTRLAIVFLQTYLKLFPTCRPVIIAPCSMLLTWEEEFRKWNVDIPFHNLNNPEYSGQENAIAVNFLKQVAKNERSPKTIRMVKLYSWKKDRSILAISYRLFEKLTGDCVEVDRGGKEKRKVQPDAGDEVFKKILLELPSLLVLDEGHTPRNKKSLIWKALSKIETQKRIILSGTPFQNNFSELYNTLCLVRPKFADRIITKSNGDFRKKRGRKSSLARGKWVSLTSTIGKDADDKLKELRAMIDPFVHVHKGYILQERLPGLRDSLVLLKPTQLQKTLLEGLQGIKNPLELGYLVSLISVHPSLVPKSYFSETKESSVDKNELERLKFHSDDGVKKFHSDDGVKTKFLIELIRLSGAFNEKVLVFSQYIDPLAFIMNQLKSHFDWTEGKEVLYMDGQRDVKQRQSSISVFNDPNSEVRVLLASTRACSEGINLVGASRVVLLDVVWNPSVERQAISRAYRIGQKKVVHIYHLITSGTMEGEIYVRQAEKDRLSELIFSSTDWKAHKPPIPSTDSEDKILEVMVQHDKLKDIFEKIHNQPKELHLIETFGLVDLANS